MKRLSKIFVCLAVLVAGILSAENTFASRYNRSKARNVINKTAYVIDQAYEVAYCYDYWSSTYLSRAVYYNDYAQDLYYHRSYRSAIRYSLRAREYALYVLDNCDDYWEFFYYTYYGWSHRYGYNPSFAYASGYRDGYYDGYYAAYCDRHHHDYHHDPHYRPHGHYDNHHSHHGNNHPPQHNTNSTVIGRGQTGTITTGSGNGGGTTISGPGFRPTNETGGGNYKNLSIGEYFSDEETALLKDVPNEQSLENDFRRNNPTVTFNDRALSTNKAVLERNKTNAQEFTKNDKNITTSRQIEKPVKLTADKNKQNDALKPANTNPKELNKPSENNNRLSKPQSKTQNSGTVDIKEPVRPENNLNKETTKPTKQIGGEKSLDTKPTKQNDSEKSLNTKPTKQVGNEKALDTKPTNQSTNSKPKAIKQTSKDSKKIERNTQKNSSGKSSSKGLGRSTSKVEKSSRSIKTEKTSSSKTERKLQRG